MIPNGFLHRTAAVDDAFPSPVRPSLGRLTLKSLGSLYAHKGGGTESNSEDLATAADDLQ